MEPRAAEGDALVVIPPRPRRAPAPPRRPSRVRAGLRWTAAVAVLVLLGAGAAGAGWRELADDDARRRAACVARAAEDAQAFAAVLGDTRPVDPAALERSCR